MRYSVSSVIQYVSTTLNDQQPGNEFAVFAEDYLLEALREGMSLLARVDPASIQDDVDFTLQPGTVQLLPQDMRDSVTILWQVCDAFVHINFSMVESGVIRGSEALVARKDNALPACPQPNEWRLRRYSWSPDKPYALFVDPPVPNDGKEYKLRVGYLSTLAKTSSFTLSIGLYSALIAYMLYKAYTVNVESNVHVTLASEQLKVFSGVSGIKLPL